MLSIGSSRKREGGREGPFSYKGTTVSRRWNGRVAAGLTDRPPPSRSPRAVGSRGELSTHREGASAREKKV